MTDDRIFEGSQVEDTIVINLPEHATTRQAEDVRSAVMKAYPDVTNTLVLTGDIELLSENELVEYLQRAIDIVQDE